MAEPASFMGFIVAAFSGTIAWAGGLTKLSYDNKGKIALLDERTQKTDDKLEKMDAKLDRLVDHLLDKED